MMRSVLILILILALLMLSYEKAKTITELRAQLAQCPRIEQPRMKCQAYQDNVRADSSITEFCIRQAYNF